MAFRTKNSFCRYSTNLNPLIQLKSSICSHLVVLGLATIVTLTGCASGGVERDTAANAAVRGGPKLEKPTAIYVGEVVTNVSVVKSNHAAEDAKRINEAFKKALLERLPEIAPTSEYSGQKSGWLVTAQALNVDFGDTTLRIVFGFGAGQAKLLYQIKVYDLAKSTTEPVHVFKTNADSGSGVGGESAPIAQVADSDYVGRNSARCARATRDELMELYKK